MRHAISEHVLGLQEVDETQDAVVGGKGAHLGALSRIKGIRVPPGFCVTTDAFRRIVAEAPSIDDRLDQLSRLKPDDREAIRTLSAEIRRTIEGIAIPGDLAAAITRALDTFGEQARMQRRVHRYESGQWELVYPSVVDEAKRLLAYLGRHWGRIDVTDERLLVGACGDGYDGYPRWPEVAEDAQRWQWIFAEAQASLLRYNTDSPTRISPSTRASAT